jgi:hypothetical protein
MKQVRADQFIREKRTQRNVRRVESAQGKIPYIALSIVIFSPSKIEKKRAYLSCTKDVEALYHAMHPVSHPQRPNPRLA